MSQPSVRLVCFDLGNVLVKVVNSWDEACGRCGLTIPASAVAWEKHHEIMRRYERGQITSEEYFSEVAGLLGEGITPEQFVKAFDAWLGDPFPGAVEMLAELKRRGVVTACLSNTNDRHWRTINEINPTYSGLKALDHVFVSHEIGEAKPDAEAYLVVERRVGFRPEEILFFDDKAENVAGARASGWNAEQILPDADPVAQQRHYLKQYGVL